MYAKALWSERPFLYATKTSLAWHSVYVCVGVQAVNICVFVLASLCVCVWVSTHMLAYWQDGRSAR